jgi:CubicO group peptidase (beta-lactamase class C family)
MRRALTALLLAVLILGSGSISAQSDFVTTRFEAYLDSLRRQVGIPGLSAAIIASGDVVWEAGLGFADVERFIPATPDTPYYLGDLTQTFTAALLLQCFEEGRLHFWQPVVLQAPSGARTTATVQELLSHTVGTGASTTFRYDPARFAQLTPTVEACGPVSYRFRLFERILGRFGMANSVPGFDFAAGSSGPFPQGLAPEFDAERLAAFTTLVQQMARPYRIDRRGRPVLTAHPTAPLNAATGVVSSVRDLARFDAGLHSFVLFTEPTMTAAWTLPPAAQSAPGVGAAAGAQRMGLGWFVQQHQGEPLVWHFGFVPDAGSALILKLPRRQITLVLLANSDGLSAGYGLAAGDVTKSPFARLFLSIFG